jgi:hypothetical protein
MKIKKAKPKKSAQTLARELRAAEAHHKRAAVLADKTRAQYVEARTLLYYTDAMKTFQKVTRALDVIDDIACKAAARLDDARAARHARYRNR